MYPSWWPIPDLAVEDILIGLPVSQHLGVEKKAFLEEPRDSLYVCDC